MFESPLGEGLQGYFV